MHYLVFKEQFEKSNDLSKPSKMFLLAFLELLKLLFPIPEVLTVVFQ